MGFHFSSTGRAWEDAFESALRFLEERPEGVLLLGPAIGTAGRAWIEDRYLSARGVRFGIRIQPWQEWVKARARDRALSGGHGFRPLNQAGKREHLRIVAEALAENDAFHHLKEIWSEERFFSGLLECITEARKAGLWDQSSVERAKGLLSRGQGETIRAAYEDFWNLLVQYENFITGGSYLDEASLLSKAAEAPVPGQDVFLLGFDELTLLETELLQRLAHESEVFLPLALPQSRIGALLRETGGDADLPAELALRGLVTGFAGRLRLVPSADSGEAPRRRFLEAHAPSEEARAAAALARACFETHDELRFVVPDGYLDDRAVARPFREELGLPETFRTRKALGHPVSRLFFHLLEVKQKGYPLAQCLEIAKLLEFTQGRFGDLASRAARAGVRKGLGDWKLKGARKEDREVLQEFSVFLEQLDRLIPEKGTAQEFAQIAEEAAKLAGISVLGHPARAPTLEFERDAHAALAGVLKNAQMLASVARDTHEVSFQQWIAEIKELFKGSPVGETLSFFPKVQFYQLGEWLPPAGSGVLTIALGLQSGVGPSPGFQFFLEEGARRRLSELLLPTNVQRGLGFLDQIKRLAAQGGDVLFSWSRHDGGGSEKEPHWVSGALDLDLGIWPEVPRFDSAAPFTAGGQVSVGDPGIESFSASFFELYKECPFKAFAERVLRLEDRVQEANLDLSRLEEGSFVHKALELFYRKHDGKDVTDATERERRLGLSVDEAVADLRIEYFMGNDRLLAAQVARLKALLLDFLRLDAEHYARFPFFATPELEKEVEGTLGRFKWKGKIDRVDLDETNRRFLITDYKIGASPPANAEIQELRRFQLQLYMDAVEKERPGWTSAGGIYASVTSGERGTGLLRKEFNAGKAGVKPGEVKYHALGATSRALLDEGAFEDLRRRSRAEAERLAEQISRGDFSVSPLDEEMSCARCSVRPACRVQQLRSAPLEPWPRPAPSTLIALLAPPPAAPEVAARARRFNPEQADALSRRDALVFIEASAGTGKTTVIVERIRRFLAERVQVEPAHIAVERFRAISFTEKSAQELAARAAASLLQDPAFGPRVAAQAQAQVSTIHGFCRKLIGEFPLEAGISPLASMLDQKGAEQLRREVIEDFFLFPEEETGALMGLALGEFSRAKVEDILVRLLEGRAIYREETERFRSGEADGARIFPEGAARDVLLCLLDLADRLAAAYEARKRERHFLDFNDLEVLTLKVLGHESVRERCRKQFELLLVDEFQDTNSLQREIFERMARPGWSNLFVVGDAKQSIYRFRAADVSVFQGLRREAEGKGNLVTLGRNYRSSREIVAAANRITEAILPAPGGDAPDFEAVNSPAVPELAAGGKVAVVEYGEPDRKWTASERRSAEAPLVAKLVRDLQSRPEPPGSIAVLLRKFSGNEAYLRALTDAGVSFRVGASKGFYGQSLVTDSIALLRVLYGAKNDLALLAVLRSPWGRASDRQLLEIERRESGSGALWDKLREEEAPLLFEWHRLATHASLTEILERALATYPQGRREHLQAVKLLKIVGGLEAEARPRAEVLELLSSWSGWDGDGADDSIMPEPGRLGTVQVMTVHAAKGLEFDVTILADLCGKLVPDNSALRLVRGAGMALKLESDEDKSANAAAHRELGRRNTERELAELKRLFYVAVTRAKKEEYFFLPRSFPELPPEKWSSCANFLRAADLSGICERVDGDAWALAGKGPAPARLSLVPAPWPDVPSYDLFRTSSITEIADFQTCPEFHRLKNIQRWDDRIVGLWKKPADVSRKKQLRRKNAPQDPSAERVAKLLKALKIERKERGIALHRVLERVKDPVADLEFARIWLREAYEAQTVPAGTSELDELIAIDMERLATFLSSPLGKSLFAAQARAYPEIPFQWKVGRIVLNGAIDRLVQNPDGSWVVVDYKSSILEQSLDDYRFQVGSYMAAVRDSESSRTGKAPLVTGFLVDLFSASPLEVRVGHDDAMLQLREELAQTAVNYTLTDGVKTKLVERKVSGGDQCLTCPYSYHCEIGRNWIQRGTL